MTEGGVEAASAAFDAVILAGGRASRLGGIDKPGLRVGGRSLLVEAVLAADGAGRIVVVGPDRDAAELDGAERSAPLFAREDPPFGGPAAALAAGLDALPPESAPWLLLLAADQPNVRAAVGRLLTAPAGPDGTLAVDPAGQRQYLLGRYRTAALRRRLGPLRAAGALTGTAIRSVLDELDLHEVVLTDDLCSDVDTGEDARRLGIRLPATTSEGTVRDMATQLPPGLDDWSRRLITALSIELDDLDIALILDVARDSAHAITRPAAPVTTFLVGYAAAKAGGGPDEIERASRIARELAGPGDAAQ